MSDLPTFISVHEARERILASVSALPARQVELSEALGLVAAADVASPVAVPAFDNSAYDGYALQAADVSDAAEDRPVRLRVVGEIQAGAAGSTRIDAGTAARIMTGAPIPPGADAIVPFEDTDRTDWGHLGDPRGVAGRAGGAEVAVLDSAPSGANVRRAGGDVQVGDVVVAGGRVIHPAEIGVLASVGVTEVEAYPRATVAIIPTGDEVVEIDAELRPGQIRNSNAWALEALARRYGAIPRRMPVAADTTGALSSALDQARDADLIVTIGGVSMGDYDLVKQVLGVSGDLGFWQINVKPGKPLAFGHIGRTPLIGLPGNPVSSMVGFELFVQPALFKLMGHTRLTKPSVQALAEQRMESSDGKRTYLRVTVRRSEGALVCAPAGDQGSHRLTSMTEGNGLADIPEGAVIETGEPVTVLALDERELLSI